MAKNKIKSGFVQIPYNVIARTTPPEERVYIVIRHFETMEKGCICSVETIGKEAGLKRTQIKKILSSLENKGLIERILRPGITTQYITIDPEGEKEAPEEKPAPQTPEEMADNPGNTLHPIPIQKMADNPVGKVTGGDGRKSDRGGVGKVTPNNIEKNNIETEQEQNRVSISPVQAHTQKRKMKSFLNFCVTGKGTNKSEFTGLDKDASSNLYKAALSIGYRMTVEEVYSFLEVMSKGIAYKRQKGQYRVNDFETLLFSWRDNQTAEKRRQAVSEQQRLVSGDEISFVYNGRSLVRNAPFKEMKSHYLLERCAELQFNFPCQDDFWKYEILSYDEFSKSQKKKIFDTLRYIPRDATPSEFLDPDSPFYWKNYIDTRGKTKKNK